VAPGCEARSLTPQHTNPRTPSTNRKPGLFIKPLLIKWAYGMSFQSSAERNCLLERYLGINNRRRCHLALARRTPIQQLGC